MSLFPCVSSLCKSYKKGICVKEYLGAGGNPDMVLRNGQTLLTSAICVGHIECVNVLIDKGANVNAALKDGQTALTVACLNNQPECLKALLRAGADTEATDDAGKTAIMHSAIWSPECTSLLIKAGADIHKTTKTLCALFFACVEGNVESISALLKAGAQMRPMYFAAATKLGYAHVLKYIIANVSNFNLNEMDIRKNTFLGMACDFGHLECVKLLVEAGARLNQENVSNMTPIAFALKNGHVEVAKTLIDAGAKLPPVDHFPTDPDAIVKCLQFWPSLSAEDAKAILVKTDSKCPQFSHILFLLNGLVYAHMQKESTAEDFKKSMEIMHLHIDKADEKWSEKWFAVGNPGYEEARDSFNEQCKRQRI